MSLRVFSVWRQADKYKVPLICFINKMDKMGANFENTLNDIIHKLGAKPLPLVYPIGSESSFVGVVDLLTLKSYIWDESDPSGIKFKTEDKIPAGLEKIITEKRHQLVETVAENDDQLLD